MFKNKDTDEGNEVDIDLHENVIVNPCGASSASSEGVSQAVFQHLQRNCGVNDAQYDRDKNQAESGPCLKSYAHTNESDTVQYVIYVKSDLRYPNRRTSSAKTFDAYYLKLEELYRSVFQLCADNQKTRVRVPMIGLGVNSGNKEVTGEMVKLNVEAAEKAWRSIDVEELFVEFCIYKQEEYQVCCVQFLFAWCVDSAFDVAVCRIAKRL